jgi:hypothetical protein
MEFKIPLDFLSYADSVIVRLNYLYPDLNISYKKDTFYVASDTSNQNIKFEKELKKEIYQQLYRAKIYEDTLPIKKWLFSKN